MNIKKTGSKLMIDFIWLAKSIFYSVTSDNFHKIYSVKFKNFVAS